MISIDEKLFITADINRVLVKYAEVVLIKQLLNLFAYNKGKKNSELFKEVNYFNGAVLPFEYEEILNNFISNFIDNLSNENLSALHYWTLNRLYLKYDEEITDTTETDLDVINSKFGHELAFKLYEPMETNLHDDLKEELKNLLINFASEFDLSKIDIDYKKIKLIQEEIIFTLAHHK
ncbi:MULTISPECIES: hypothetical protein [Mesonia]|uniref:Uncharacterized protein n=1 Tax=Mesonia oceanica TaxID=2687242 RepID=A0AC61Y7G7_9FLAO|nr:MULTISPECIES: hypothetical protein [Mesonia]MAN26301.1 hypothetical protein [Mesonia sp.]MAQ42171.1 hypothetical protein [Mesonia sp.]MBJ97959.1 hypothetical protein [Flavobacteriaceae bacterium]VVV00130.1 hypothetical protein FVB9532_01395 [Mesonia oceanica]|tara:strand:- start:2374 stop:2907 length:534 start_codon:yes stop_codon:yes gene_type:complete